MAIPAATTSSPPRGSWPRRVLAKLMKETPGRVLVIGTPDEERGSLGGGKTALLEGGHFQGADVVLITHPGGSWSTDQRFLAMKRATFTFKGKTAHAASAPHQGVNALRAAILTFNAVDMLREHLRQDVRIHGIIKKGGEAVNVVPALAEAEFAARALDTATMEDAYNKMVNCAKAAELATGANAGVQGTARVPEGARRGARADGAHACQDEGAGHHGKGHKR